MQRDYPLLSGEIRLPEEVGSALRDGVILCHLVNQLQPRSVYSVHVPSPGQPMLGLAKCRRNVENFLEACRRLGVPEVSEKAVRCGRMAC